MKSALPQLPRVVFVDQFLLARDGVGVAGQFKGLADGEGARERGLHPGRERTLLPIPAQR